MEKMEENMSEEIEKKGNEANIMPENPDSVVIQKLTELAESDETTAAFLSDLLDTGDVLKSLARNYDPEELEAAIESVKSEDYNEDIKTYQGKIKSRKDRASQLESNKAESQKSAQEFMDMVNPSDEDVEGFIAFYDSFIRDAVDNKMTLDHWQTMWKAYKRDNDVQQAQETGEIIGRNAKIEATKATKKDMEQLLPGEALGAKVASQEQKPRSFGAEFMRDIQI
jgi:hypothetical protein